MSELETSYRQPPSTFKALSELLDYIVEKILPSNRQMIGLLVLGNVIPLYLRDGVYTGNQHSFSLWVCLYMVCYHFTGPRGAIDSGTAPETGEVSLSPHVPLNATGLASDQAR